MFRDEHYVPHNFKIALCIIERSNFISTIIIEVLAQIYMQSTSGIIIANFITFSFNVQHHVIIAIGCMYVCMRVCMHAEMCKFITGKPKIT